MAHTNSTTNYALPQYVGSDIINPLVDTNGAYETIDTQLKANADAASTADGKAVAVGDRVTTLEGKVEALETQNGTEVLNTTKQTLSGAINELDAELNTPNTGVVAKIGTGSLTTTSQTIIAAINELKAAIDAL